MHNSELYATVYGPVSKSLESLDIPEDAKKYILSRLEANLRNPSLAVDAHSLICAFPWSDSPEGFDFWSLVDLLT